MQRHFAHELKAFLSFAKQCALVFFGCNWLITKQKTRVYPPSCLVSWDVLGSKEHLLLDNCICEVSLPSQLWIGTSPILDTSSTILHVVFEMETLIFTFACFPLVGRFVWPGTHDFSVVRQRDRGGTTVISIFYVSKHLYSICKNLLFDSPSLNSPQ